MTRGWQAMRAWMVACALAAAGMATAAVQVNKSAAPDWVEAFAPPLADAAATDKAQTGTVYLLADMQTRVEPAGGRQAWRHYAMLARDTQAVESLANIDVSFDPSYQTLALHLLRVHRGGQVLDRLKAAQVRVIQRERDLETLIYDGSRTASVFLDDVRVGDVIEYAYSISGANPVFGGRQFGRFDLQWSRPLAQLRARLLWPAGRPLAVHGAPEQTAVEQRPLGAYTEYRVQRDQVPGLRVESDAPAWYDPYATLYWSEFKAWPDVAAWALPLYGTPTDVPAPLRAERDRILATYTSPADRAAAALRWVQREIRYLGIEVGANSHAPTPPATVVARRFGDCKDKALVAVTLLRALGLQAEPALVNTERQRGLSRGLPTPGAFNHVIVRLRLAGNTYWLDATRRPQPGALDSLSQPDWGLALPVNGDGEGLVAMDSSAAARGLRKVHLLVDASAGLAAPTMLTVTSELWGRTAEAERSTHATDGTERVQERYLNFYAADYPGLRVAAPMELHDDPETNRLRVVEHYEMPAIFQHSDEKKRLEANFYAPEVRGMLNAPRETVRKAPLELEHQVEVTHDLEIRLPEGWPVKAKVTEVDNPAFTLRHELRGEQPVGGDFRVIRLIDQYRSRADHVDADAVASYTAALEKARNSLGYSLYKRDDADATAPAPQAAEGGGFNLTVALFGVLVLLALGWALPRLYRWDPAPPTGEPQPFNLRLMWIGLCVLALPVRAVVAFVQALPGFSQQAWDLFTKPGGEHYHPWMTGVLLGEMAIMLTLIGASLLLAVVYFKRRSSTPFLFAIVMWGSVALSALDDALTAAIPVLADNAEPTRPGAWVGTVLMLGLYTAYLLGNARARLSFTRRLAETPAATAPEVAPIIEA